MCLRHVLDMLWKCFGHDLHMFWTCFGICWDIVWTSFGQTVGQVCCIILDMFLRKCCLIISVNRMSLVALCCLSLVAFSAAAATPSADEVRELPGYGVPEQRTLAGYVEVNKSSDGHFI